jgi:diadenosine tetraphosphate (Ap4A) HIT family hydrolase
MLKRIVSMCDPAGMCPFCERAAADVVICQNELAVAFPDGFPVSPGHLLVVPTRHERDWFGLSPDEQTAVLALLPAARSWIEARHRPDGYNIGVNVGSAAGQTVEHAHLHLIPRYAGDAADPRGGVRWVLPAKAPYWQR